MGNTAASFELFVTSFIFFYCHNPFVSPLAAAHEQNEQLCGYGKNKDHDNAGHQLQRPALHYVAMAISRANQVT